MLSRADGRRDFFYTPIIVDRQTRTIAEALRYNSLVFVAQDGGFLCQTCVSSTCNEMLEATCDYDESKLPPECRQWCIIGAQEPELGHGDKCGHCGAFTLPKPTDCDFSTPPRYACGGGDCDGGHDA